MLRTVDALLERVEMVPVTGCWLWAGSWIRNGYGQVKAGGKMFLAHRLSYEIHFGPIPAGAQILHRCDTKPCINPGHLFLGDHPANMRDKCSKGRQSRGERHGAAKLTEDQVRAILRRGASCDVLAARFGVSRTQIQRIWRRTKWAHLQ